jgi:hypothetical protein
MYNALNNITKYIRLQCDIYSSMWLSLVMQGLYKSFTMIFQMLLCGECYENFTLKGVQTIQTWKTLKMDRFCAFKWKRFL